MSERIIGCSACGNQRFKKEQIVTLNADYVPVEEKTKYICSSCGHEAPRKGVPF